MEQETGEYTVDALVMCTVHSVTKKWAAHRGLCGPWQTWMDDGIYVMQTKADPRRHVKTMNWDLQYVSYSHTVFIPLTISPEYLKNQQNLATPLHIFTAVCKSLLSILLTMWIPIAVRSIIYMPPILKLCSQFGGLAIKEEAERTLLSSCGSNGVSIWSQWR